MLLRRLALFAGVLLSLATSVSAQTLNQVVTQDTGTTNDSRLSSGQTFIWPSNAPLTGIAVQPRSSPTNFTLTIFSGASGCDLSAGGSPIYTQTGIDMSLNGYSPVVLTAPVAMTQGGTYTFCFQHPVGAASSTVLNASINNPYPDGTAVFGSSVASNYDLKFRLFAGDPPAPVPALPEWAMILFGAALAGGAALVIKQRRRTA